MGFFNAKSLVFYLGTIGLVIGLFTVCSNYGEASLKPERKIAGKYTIVNSSAAALQGQILELDQSGVYLNGALYSATKPKNSNNLAATPHSLSGVKQGTTWVLVGTISAVICGSSVDQVTAPTQLAQSTTTLTFTVESSQPLMLQGQLTCPNAQSSPTGISFTAQKIVDSSTDTGFEKAH
ncbi:hypothetical protein ACN4EG_05155 [Alkalinema pantanalense CENA528]|uniref:hypothetical protein n=1 Tax=Alkalinema pantanalense TaxID=1620705 RepID=UPI003D6E2DB5